MLASALLSWHDKREHAALIKNSNNFLAKLFQTDVDNVAHRLPLQAFECSRRFSVLVFISSRVSRLSSSLSAVWVEFRPFYFHASFARCISVQRATGPGDVFPYKEVFHLSACHQQTTVESGKPLGRMPEKLICIARWTTCKFKFFNLDKCISLSRQIHFANQRNTFCNLDKYIFWFGQIQFGTDARETHLHSTRDNL